jgi:protein involved in polysaccharide export with SLBB domain
MVRNSTGKLLPVYGTDLFRHTPSTFAPLDKVPVAPDYVIGPGDELLIQIWGQVTLDSRFTVDRSGSIYIPKVGTIRVAGLPFGQLQDYIKAHLSRNFRNFDLNVNLGELRSIQVFVVGQAKRPGSYTISSLSTLVNALFVTGGPNARGSLRHIQLKRAGKVLVDFDLYALLQNGDKSSDMQLLPGDVIYIPPVGPQVAVVGGVNAPGIYELKSAATTTVSDVLDLASGPTSVASDGSIRLERVDAHRMRSITDFSENTAWKSTRVQDGDIVEVVPVIGRYTNGVTLRGNVANPGHFAWKEGMRVKDLLPDKDSLVTRNYWLKRALLGKPLLNYLPTCPVAIKRPGEESASRTSVEPEPEDCIPNSNVSSNSPYDRQSINPDSLKADAMANGRTSDRQDLTKQGGNQASGSSTAAAMAGKPSGQFEPLNDVKLSEPDIDWSYAVIERQDKNTLTTTLLPFNLGRLILEGDSTQNLPLQPNDVVTIFSKADIQVPQSQQTRLVRLEGEFISPGIYSVRSGETLQDLVRRAGGFTREAYPYGSEFTRESTRKVQQQRLKEYVDQIALQTSTNSANSANRSLSALDAAASAAAAAQSQNIVNSLRQSRASGRIVLQLRPDSDNVNELPQIALEDGDRFVVPHRPATVNVAGAVYNPNTFLYNSSSRLGDYLQLAGGPNRDAEKKSVYVIRADGSVVSKGQLSSWRNDRFQFLHIYPGDTVIVPLNLNKGTALRNVVDIAQIVGQFGLAAAATSVVF